MITRLFRRSRTSTSRARAESNRWLRHHAATVKGSVLSIGSRDDSDGEGGRYREYFRQATEYLTSEVEVGHGCDMVVDVRAMDGITDESLDCIFCSGVLEHVDDFMAAIAEIRRVLRPGGTLLLGVPFRQAIHLAPHDYWRFTEHGARVLLRDGFEVLALEPIDASIQGFPAAYWIEARRIGKVGDAAPGRKQ